MLTNVQINKEIELRVKELWSQYPFSIGIPVIDLQHICLIFSIIKLQQSIQNKLPPPNLQKDIFYIIDFLIQHFKTEEKLLSLIHFPQFDSHTKKHIKYIEQLRILHGNDIEAANVYKAADEILNVLQNWLFEHLRKDDQKYGSYLLELGEISTDYNKQLLEEVNIHNNHILLYQNITKDFSTFEINIEQKTILSIKEIWENKNLATDIPVIDMQHLWLIKIFVELDISAKKSGIIKRNEIFLNTLLASYEYVSQHFKTEELIMRNFKFPQYNNHVIKHRKFGEFLRLRNEENKSNDSMATYNLLQDLRNWIYSHIAVEDRELKIFLKDKIKDVNLFVKHINSKGELDFNSNQVKLYRQIVTPKTNQDSI